MIYTSVYRGFLGEIGLASRDNRLIGLWFLREQADTQRFYNEIHTQEIQEKSDEPILRQAKEWLEQYFGGKKPSIDEIPLEPSGSGFAKIAWNLLIQIPYGEVCTYGELAKEVAKITHKEKMAAQAIGGAVGRNPIGIIIPCHRVIGANGNLTGYTGGIEKKIALLELERANIKRLYYFDKTL